MKRKYKTILGAVGSVILLILMFLWMTGNLSSEPKIAPRKVETSAVSAAGKKTVEVAAMTVPVEIEAVGTVSAKETADVSSRIMAVITKISADAGDTVKKGQPLVELDSRDIHARLVQAKEAVASAEAALERARLDAGRIERLYEKQAATKQENDATQASLKMAQASVEAAKAAVREAEVNLSFTKVTAPVDGRVIDRFADPGDMAAPGKPILSMYVPSSLRLEVPVAEKLRPDVNVGDEVRASIDTVQGDFLGTVVEIVPASDSSSRSFIVRVSIPSSKAVYSGMYGRIWIPTGSNQVIIVPPDAVEHVGQLEMVTVVKDGAARTRMVKTGREYPQGIEILSGLSPGETVVIHEFLKDTPDE